MHFVGCAAYNHSAVTAGIVLGSLSSAFITVTVDEYIGVDECYIVLVLYSVAEMHYSSRVSAAHSSIATAT